MSTRPRVPAALHGELTEYASLLRALRTQHTLDLSAHLSQLSRRSSQSLDNDGESELVSSDEDDSVLEGKDQRLVLEDDDEQAEEPSQSRRSASTTTEAPEGSHPVHSQSNDTRQTATGKKRKRQSTNDTWTRWPLLVGDVYHPEWDLAEEVNLIASHVSRQRRQHSASSNDECNQHSQSNSDDGDDGHDAIFIEDEDSNVAEVVSRALAASTAAHLRSILSACSTLVPRVEPSLRSRLAPLNWKSVLAAAGSAGLVSPQSLERVQTRLEALYSPGPSAVHFHRPLNASSRGNISISLLLRMHLFTEEHIDHAEVVSSTPSSNRLPTYAAGASAVKAARAKLHSAIAERKEQGDGDFLSFPGPLSLRLLKTRKREKKNRRIGMKQEESGEKDVEALAKNEDHTEMNEEKGEIERNDSESESESGSGESDSEESDLVPRDEG